ncbi:MAG: DUF2589 domain-containing protein [Oscillospiraceae bacterium]|nr:DUF2589 domain-containing protein [Oscillospiraceae bacterium]
MSDKKQMDNTVELQDLVYAPLGAIAGANIQLSSSIVDLLASTGDLSTDQSGEKVVKLRTIQMMYEQLRSDSMNNSVADCIGLEVPLLSIYPLSALKVSKTKVSFGAEIRGMQNTADGLKIFTQVSSANQRAGASQPQISYEVELDSAGVSEGLARFVDILNTQSMPKLLSSRPVDNTGRRLAGQELEDYQRTLASSRRESELVAKLGEVRELIRTQNNTLQRETGMSFDEYKENLEHLQESNAAAEVPEAYRQIERFQPISAELEAELNELRMQIVKKNVTQAAQEE